MNNKKTMFQTEVISQLILGTGIDALSLLAGLTVVGAASFGALYITVRKKTRKF